MRYRNYIDGDAKARKNGLADPVKSLGIIKAYKKGRDAKETGGLEDAIKVSLYFILSARRPSYFFLSVYLSIGFFSCVYVSACLFASFFLSVCLSICFFLPVCLPACLPLPACTPACLSVCFYLPINSFLTFCLVAFEYKLPDCFMNAGCSPRPHRETAAHHGVVPDLGG